jgi:outer membrane receptor protein involved in Fe transport
MSFYATNDYTVRHTNLYTYALLTYPENMIWTFGASGDFFHDPDKDEEQFNPKFGVIWTPFLKTTVRGAIFRSLKRNLIADQTLEPTQVAGFNQFFDDGNAADAWRYGIGIDQKLSSQVYAGAEFSRRDLEEKGLMPSETGDFVLRKFDCREYLSRAYLYWTPHPWLALGLEYQYERLKNPADFPKDTVIGRLKTHRVSIGINFFHPSGFYVRLKPAYLNQDGSFASPFPGPPPPFFLYSPDRDHSWVVDASAGYRLPKRLGIISIEIKNLTDESFQFQDTDPAKPRVAPDQLVLARWTLAF